MKIRAIEGGVLIEGDSKVHRLSFSADSQGNVCLDVFDNATGAFKGTPHRYKLGGADRLAADAPGVDSNWFIVDGNNNITNG